jgi:hypothetical protein
MRKKKYGNRKMVGEAGAKPGQHISQVRMHQLIVCTVLQPPSDRDGSIKCGVEIVVQHMIPV